jgi:hypothetical protein
MGPVPGKGRAIARKARASGTGRSRTRRSRATACLSFLSPEASSPAAQFEHAVATRIGT